MKIFTSILLIITAAILATILFPFCLVYSFISFVIDKSDGTVWYSYFFRIALGIDELGNVVCNRLFNDVLITKQGYPFGLQKETISSALGKNVARGTLRPMGRLLNLLLNKIQANHAIISIDNTVNNNIIN